MFGTHTHVGCTEAVKLTEVLFGRHVCVGQRNLVLDGGADPPTGRDTTFEGAYAGPL